ncbi:YbaB/EbfC family nucleoid-associated protein [Solihabitans fulvus]|uniref:YbaB/EbfC family nucleoid-associated protein n=1 Tax=Solihabitans fulvus TaxID=1892852 RepID=UPI001661931B|nr:YbaB/EbfC family nucleoid-associated protein [Solihabitans fulvus]
MLDDIGRGGGAVEPDVSASEQLVSQWEQELNRNAARYQEMSDRVQQLSVTETSRDGLVRITVGANGIPTDIAIAEPARERPMSDLSRQIMTCLRRAQARIPELLQQTMTETLT